MSRTNSAAVMPTSSQRNTPERAPTTDHLSLHLTGSPAGDLLSPLEKQQKRMGGALGTSVLAHVAFLLLFILFVRLAPEPVRNALLPDRLSEDIVWLAQPGPGGGGGGGNKMPDPPKKAELPGKEKISVPAIKEPEPTPKVEEPPIEAPLSIPAQVQAADTTPSPGVLESNAQTTSTGSGTGTGAGPGQGSGLGPGSGGGTGGGTFRPGNGVEIPKLLRQVKPSYTSEAMRAKVQGVVLLECVVDTDGTVGRCGVQKSLDQAFGLDQEAIKAAQQWRFQPGTRFGEPVKVLVTIELTFTLR